jgi:hypothetical protein
LDSCVGGVFRKKTPAEAEELMAKISQNYNDWTMAKSTPAPAPTPTPTPTPAPAPMPVPTPKKRGMIELNDEVMREAKKSRRRVLNLKT